MGDVSLLNLIWGIAVTVIGLLIYAAIKLARIDATVKANQTLTQLLFDTLDKRVTALERMVRDFLAIESRITK